MIEGADASLRRGESPAAHVWPTGFVQLDTYLAGGLRSGELTLLGGPQGLGKTTFVLQVARHAAAAGSPAVYVSFEHDEMTVLERLLAIEASVSLGLEAASVKRIREAFENPDPTRVDRRGIGERVSALPGGGEALAGVRGYADLVYVHRASAATTTVDTIREVVTGAQATHGRAPLLVVDYLQKVWAPGSPEEKVTSVVEGLKDLALEADMPVLAVVAADREGLAAGRRLRVAHLRGASALAYEADVVLLMNDKYDVVARHHLVYDAANADRFRNYVVLTVEKNRTGVDRVDLQLRKRFEQARFDTDADLVAEQLIDERLFVE